MNPIFGLFWSDFGRKLKVKRGLPCSADRFALSSWKSARDAARRGQSSRRSNRHIDQKPIRTLSADGTRGQVAAQDIYVRLRQRPRGMSPFPIFPRSSRKIQAREAKQSRTQIYKPRDLFPFVLRGGEWVSLSNWLALPCRIHSAWLLSCLVLCLLSYQQC
jgi:hypothetical protein